MDSTSNRAALMRNFGATAASRYGSKVLEFLILSAAMRYVEAAEVGVVFFAQASGSLAFHLIDGGLYSVLARRAAHRELSRSPVTRLALMRALGVLLITIGFAAITAFRRPESAAIATGFFFAGGLVVVGEVPRSVIAGKERFVLLARLNVFTKVLEAGIAIGGIVAGYGLLAWLVARTVSQIVLLATTWPAAVGDLPEGAREPGVRTLLKEGLPFWLTRISGMFSARLSMILVSLWVSFEATAHLGIATRVVGAATSMVGALTTVLYPVLARERTREINRQQVGVMLLSGVLLLLPVLIGAPWIVRLLVGHPDPTTVTVVRIVAPSIALFTLSRPLKTWLQAMHKERPLLIVSFVNATFGVLLLLLLVPRFELWGAAAALPLKSVFGTITTAGLTAYVLRRER